MAEIELDGVTFDCGKLRTRTQYHVVRRLMPALGEFMPLFTAQQYGEEVPFTAWFSAITRAIPALDDADSDYVLDHCLAAVKFKAGDRWQVLVAPNGGGLMLNEADRLDTQLRLVFEVLKESLENFSFDRLLGLTPPNGLLPTAMATAA